jgi:predicted DNA-binding transcriptional regulator YafY
MNRIDRLTAILIHLQTKKVVKAEEIADRFEMSLRTVYRDVRALMEAGVPIGSEGGKGYFIVDGYHLPPVMFNQEEASSIVLAGKLVEKMTDESVRKAFQSALMKIKSVLDDTEKDHLETLESFVEVQPPRMPEGEFPNRFLTDIQKALVHKDVLQMEYHSTTEELTEREVEPIGMFYYSAGWHLIAWCRMRNGYRDFRADRIKDLVNTGVQFDRRNLMSLHEYLKSFMQSHQGLEEVSIIFEKGRFKKRNYMYSSVLEEDLGDRVRVTFLADSLSWLSKWLLSYGRSVEIEKPERLRIMVSELVEELHAHYASVSAVPAV